LKLKKKVVVFLNLRGQPIFDDIYIHLRQPSKYL